MRVGASPLPSHSFFLSITHALSHAFALSPLFSHLNHTSTPLHTTTAPFLPGYQPTPGPAISYGLQRIDHVVGNVPALLPAVRTFCFDLHTRVYPRACMTTTI